ncbi:MAG: transposase [Ottowia sp.]
MYRARNAVEHCFGRLKQYRRIATRYERKDEHFRAFLLIAASLAWMTD